MANRFVSERSIRFLLYDLHDLESLSETGYFAHINRQLSDQVLKAALALAKKKLYPILDAMDKNSPELVEGRVRVHPDVRELMLEYGRGGWVGAGFSEEDGGEQLPAALAAACRYIFAAANYSASVYPELTAGAAELILSFGTQDLIETYVPPMLEGRWQGTMALTEPQAGSSLADITTTAFPTDDGGFRIQGHKTFISAGDHNGVDNVVHLMLARIDGAPAGTRGISLFVVPKKRPCENGTLIDNDITTAAVFHKLGYRGAPITELSIGEKGGCRGYLVGKPHHGLSYMFQMMNEARLGVGLGATAIASAAYYAALEYAQSRTQGRPLTQKDPSQPQVPIIEHADVRRMLLFQRAVTEGSLSLILQCCMYADRKRVAQGKEKEKSRLLLDLLTPIAKSYPSEMGIWSVSQAIQCFGGYGYCEDFPVEQYFRDSRIHPIHEGTTGVQAMDLLGRKLVMENGRAASLFIEELKASITEAAAIEPLAPYAARLDTAVKSLESVFGHLLSTAADNGPEAFLCDATLFLEFAGIITIAWQWLKQAIVATRSLAAGPSRKEKQFLDGKLVTFRYFFRYELPKTLGLAERLTDNDRLTLEMTRDGFVD